MTVLFFILGLFIYADTADASSYSMPAEMIVFSTYDNKPTFVAETKRNGTRVTIYFMDTLKHLEKQLSKGLPTTEREAEKIAKRRIEKFASEIEKRVGKLSKGINVFQYYGLENYPAAVVNGCHFVYGSTDTREIARAWRKAGSCD